MSRYRVSLEVEVEAKDVIEAESIADQAVEKGEATVISVGDAKPVEGVSSTRQFDAGASAC